MIGSMAKGRRDHQNLPIQKNVHRGRFFINSPCNYSNDFINGYKYSRPQ